MKIIIVRHGESLGNSLRIMAGHTDVPLTERGIAQAEMTAHALADERIDAVYSSDLSRAIDTAKPHAERRGLRVRTEPLLREIYLGDYEGMKIADVEEKIDPNFSTYWGEGFGTYQFPGGENAPEAGERFYAALVKIAEENEGKTVLVATHAAVIRAFFGRIKGIPPHELGREIPFPINASYSTVEYREGGFIPLEFSVSEHLCKVGFLGVSRNK